MQYCHYILLSIIILWTSGTTASTKVNEWKKSAGPYPGIKTPIRTLALDGNSGIYAVASEEGIFYASPGNDMPSWKRLSKGIPAGTQIHAIATSKNVIHGVFAWSYNRMFRLRHGSDTWIEAGKGLEKEGLGNVVMDSEGNAFCGASSGLFKFDEGSNKWIKLPELPYWNKVEGARNMAIGRSGALFIGVKGGGIIRSTDAGTTWATVIEPEDHTGVSVPRLKSGPT